MTHLLLKACEHHIRARIRLGEDGSICFLRHLSETTAEGSRAAHQCRKSYDVLPLSLGHFLIQRAKVCGNKDFLLFAFQDNTIRFAS